MLQKRKKKNERTNERKAERQAGRKEEKERKCVHTDAFMHTCAHYLASS